VVCDSFVQIINIRSYCLHTEILGRVRPSPVGAEGMSEFSETCPAGIYV